jgi:2-polyprenyl-6-methoxyphenol hydroxylase-like FAD-dependent oxidoreductase
VETIDTRSIAESLDVPAVVGAGPAGLVTAIGLARATVCVPVIERHPLTSIFPRATGVSTRSMEIFRGWGIEDEVRRGGWHVIPRQATVQRLDERDPREEALGFPDDAACLAVSPTTAAVSPQDHLEPVLVQHLRELGGHIRFSTELKPSITTPMAFARSSATASPEGGRARRVHRGGRWPSGAVGIGLGSHGGSRRSVAS